MMEIRLDRVPDSALGGEQWEFVVDEEIPRTDLVVSSVRIWKINDAHTGIRFWNRGRGTVNEWSIVATRDALPIVARLFGVSLGEFAASVASTIRKTFHF
jgi:hypothetical protein